MAKQRRKPLPKEVRQHLNNLSDALADVIQGEPGAATGASAALWKATAAARRFASTSGDRPTVVTFEWLIARTMRQFRLQSHLSQEALAANMTMMGFDWKRITVAEVERLARRVSFLELLGLAALFGVRMVGFLLLEPGTALQFPDGRIVEAELVNELIQGQWVFNFESGTPLRPDEDVDSERDWQAAALVAGSTIGFHDWRPAKDLDRPWEQEPIE
ncbi:MAG: hypothetical protein ABR529_09135 [Actinomycetota bacterium]